MLSSIVAQALCLDPNPSLYWSDEKCHQLECMKRAIVNPQYKSKDWLEQFGIPHNRDASNVCRYKGIHCADENIFAFALQPLSTRFAGGRMAVDVRWLPSEMNALYLQYVVLRGGCPTRMLPRDLRFLHINQSEAGGKTDLNLQCLPNRMQELHVMRFFDAGVINLFHLPPDFRILQLAGCGVTKKIFVDPLTVPKCFGFLRIVPSRYDTETKIVYMRDRGRKSINIETDALHWDMEESMFHNLIQLILSYV